MIVKIKLTHWLCSLFQSLQLFYIILGWDRKDIDRTELFVIFNNRGITENGFGTIFHSLFPLWSVSTMTSFSFVLFQYEFTYVTVSWFQLFSLNNFFLFSYLLVSYLHHAATQNPYFNQSLLSPCGNTRSWSWHQICDTSFFLFIVKFYDWSNFLMWSDLSF